MGAFKLLGMTFGSLFKKPETFQYPFQQRELPKGLKGQVVNDAPNCILCGICQKSCPCNAIIVMKDEREWEIDPFLCIQCGSCIRACPKKCLSMDPHYTSIATSKYIKEVEVPEGER